MTVLREQLLADRAIALGGGAGDVVGEALAALGARVEPLPSVDDLPGADDAAGEWARAKAPLDGLIYGGSWCLGDGEAELLAALEHCWVTVREVAVGALIPGGAPAKVLLLGPPAGPVGHSGAVRAALENLARTLSVEWARYAITTTMIAPGPRSTDAELGELACYLVSEAGAYFSGCRLELGAVEG